jgi:hypothetical protein
VNKATIASPEYKGRQDGTTYNPYGVAFLEVGRTYYWRIDEVNDAPAYIQKGEVWSFTTETCAVIDNFNSYIDDATLWNVWKDGWTNGTQSQIFRMPASTSSKLIHGTSGNSMEYQYDNSGGLKYSEANSTMTALGFDPNWYAMGAKSLSLWFRGVATNDSTQPMYVTLTDSDNNSAEVVYDGDADDVKEESWFEWVIPMTDFTADVNADNTYDANVTDSNDPCGVTGDTNGFGSQWYYYPESQWWNIWLDNGRYDPHRKKDILILLWVKKRNALNPAVARFLSGGATVEWMADPNGSIRPPLPSDTPSLELEERYIDRTADPCVFVPTATWQLVVIRITLPWNPRWVFLDIRGYNYDIMGGIIIHRCRSFLNLRKMRDLVIGFGYGVQPQGTGAGTVYFDDITLCASRCALLKRAEDFALVDYAPGGAPGGDCSVDYGEVLLMANSWLAHDSFTVTKDPGTLFRTAYFSFDEGDGNTTRNWARQPTDPCYLATLSPYPVSRAEKPVTWTTPGVMLDPTPPHNPTGHAVHFAGQINERIDGGRSWHPNPVNNNKMTLAIWAKWAGPHTDREKCQGLISKRVGWNANGVYFMFECDTVPDPRGSFGLRRFGGNVWTPAGLLNPLIGQWVHLAATVDPTATPVTQICKLYLNAAQVANGDFQFGGGDPCQIDLTIGQVSDFREQGVESFKGDLDEVYIFNRVLEVNEIAYLADTSPWDGILYAPVPSSAEIYYDSSEPPGQRIVNFKDFAVMAKRWLEWWEWP